MKKNIAILYDIENMVGGYNLKYLSEISLKNILEELNKNGYNSIAIQKAYADWSNNRLNELKWDIAELGIEPIQMYGFSKGSTKNASDIQLVIDALEILHTKEFIDIFVIVSGDGGFSSLVKKLSEYGKTVIGCAFKQSTNDIFSKICDEFIYIEDTFTNDQLNIIKNITMDDEQKLQIIQNPILKNSMYKIKQINANNLDEVLEKADEIIRSLQDDKDGKYLLSNEGMNISMFKSALNYSIKDFDFFKYGFGKLIDFIRYIIKDTDVKLILKKPSEYRLILKSKNITGFIDIEPILTPNLKHSYEHYKIILETQRPVIYIPENNIFFYNVINYMLLNSLEFRSIVYDDNIKLLLKLNIEEKELNNILHMLINCSILKGDNSLGKMKEQFYYFSPIDMSEVLENIHLTVRSKLSSILKEKLNEEIIERIMKVFSI